MTENAEQSEWSFDKWAENYDDSIASDDGCFGRYDDVLDAVVEAARVQPGMQVLDIGVGTGNLALRCVELGAEVVGLDPFEGMLARAEIKLAGHPNIHLAWCEDPFLSLPAEDASFDAIVSTYAFHHVLHEEQSAAVKELNRVLKPGGVIAIGDLMFENARLQAKALITFDWLDHEYHSRINELRDMFATCGMELTCRQFTPVSWVVYAIKPEDG